MKKYIIRITKGYIPVILIIIILLLLFFPRTEVVTETKTKIITDTVFVDKIKTIIVEKEKIVNPNKLLIQKTTNKPLRDTIESKPVIIGVHVNNSTLEVQSIDTCGVISEAVYKLEGDNEIIIDSNSNVSLEPDKKAIKKEKRKKFFRKAGVVTVAIVAFVLGALAQ
jgi:hypothetical protein